MLRVACMNSGRNWSLCVRKFHGARSSAAFVQFTMRTCSSMCFWPVSYHENGTRPRGRCFLADALSSGSSPSAAYGAYGVTQCQWASWMRCAPKMKADRWATS